MKILWCITGAGHLLEECCLYMLKTADKKKTTVVFSAAGYEVARMYGLLNKITEGFHEIIFEETQGASTPIVGRLSTGEYSKVIVAPCTANTTAKIIYGIADSLVTNIVAQAGKCRIPIYILPTDATKKQKTQLPLTIDQEKCVKCRPCPVVNKCPAGVLYQTDKVHTDLMKCTGCRICMPYCSYGAISLGREVEIQCRNIDIENAAALERIEYIHVIKKIAEAL